MNKKIVVLLAFLAISVAIPASAQQRNRRGGQPIISDSVGRLMDYNRSYIYGGPSAYYGSYGRSSYTRGYSRSYGRSYDRRRDYTWGSINTGLLLAGTIYSDVRANRRHDEHMRELYQLREQRVPRVLETPRDAERRGYYAPVEPTQPMVRPPQRQPDQFTVINETGTPICLDGIILRSGEKMRVDDADLDVTAPVGVRICEPDAEFINADTIKVFCATEKGK